VSDLDPITPEEAVDLYLEAMRDEKADSTLDAQMYRLRAFVAWCDEEGIDDLSQLDGRDLYAYRVWRREGGYDDEELKTVTLKGDLATIRTFLRFCADIEAVAGELYDQVPLPSIDGEGDVSDSTLPVDRADGILDYLERYEYASRDHVVLLTLWHTGCRAGELRALDLDDLDLHGNRAGATGPAVHFRHRPGTGTPLKNKDGGKRWASISSHVARVLEDWIDGPRPQVLDEHDRAPLITTQTGRIAVSTMRDSIYRVTRPCWRGEPCPHDRDPETCEATRHEAMSKCPSSRSPHDVRSGRVTAYRLDDVPRQVVSDRMNASREILDKH